MDDGTERPKTRAELRKSATKKRRWPALLGVLVLVGAVAAGGAWLITSHHKGSSTVSAACPADMPCSTSPAASIHAGTATIIPTHNAA